MDEEEIAKHVADVLGGPVTPRDESEGHLIVVRSFGEPDYGDREYLHDYFTAKDAEMLKSLEFGDAFRVGELQQWAAELRVRIMKLLPPEAING
jgi:hypothetical protein